MSDSRTRDIRGKGIYKFSNILLNTCETEGIGSNDGEEQEMNFERRKKEREGKGSHGKIVEKVREENREALGHNTSPAPLAASPRGMRPTTVF